MVDLTPKQQIVLATAGHQLVTGGPGSGKTTVSILKAAKIARETLKPGQRVLFLSFARATVSRVLEAIDEEQDISPADQSRIEVDTYHSFFWRLLKTHGYLVGLPRRISILAPPGEAIALATIRREYGADKKLDDAELTKKRTREKAERDRLAFAEGKICFDLFADLVARLLEESAKLRALAAITWPCIILDEFQDTSAAQWRVVKALGDRCTLIALADPEQRIFEFIGADPARLDHFKAAFAPTFTELGSDNHRSKDTDILLFGNEVLTANFSKSEYEGIVFYGFPSNRSQAYAALVTRVLQARARLIATGRPAWSLAILVPTKRMMRLVSDILREPFGNVPAIAHAASIDMEGPILAADVIALLLQQARAADDLDQLVHLMCQYLRGRGGPDPGKGDLGDAIRLERALAKWNQRIAAGRAPHANSVIQPIAAVLYASQQVVMLGDPDKDWIAIRAKLADGACPRLRAIANDARNVRLLERGNMLRNTMEQNWRERGRYADALDITRLAFVQDHFATTQRPETGIVVMNMHKAKGKQFDEVIIFEGWPVRVGKEIKANPDRIVRENKGDGDLSQARQNFRVSVTRAKLRTTIMTPHDDVCILLESA
ncbi:UvrD-helicase domain-containing protein [Chachezhania sediminis]|uniref:UvrD-helicase domain-containing protein n=1 Tax=Chachezhania sediminis TaxID=2599291 RepID=UPI00131E0DAD|nr:ATP-dependent helicase [Chachezhania sediminis]